MHTDRTAVTIQSNQIVSMKVKTTKHYWSHLIEKKKPNKLFGQPDQSAPKVRVNT